MEEKYDQLLLPKKSNVNASINLIRGFINNHLVSFGSRWLLNSKKEAAVILFFSIRFWNAHEKADQLHKTFTGRCTS